MTRSHTADSPAATGRTAWDRNGYPILALVALFVDRHACCRSTWARWRTSRPGSSGMYSLGLDEKEILAGVSGDLILTLIGVTYLFAIARNNGTVDLIVRKAVQAVGGRVALIPWVMFVVTALLTAHRRGQPGGLRDHRPDRARLRRPLQDQPAADGHVRRPRRPGRRLLADQHLRHHHQLGDGARTACPSSEITVFLASLVVNLIIAVDPVPRPRRPRADVAPAASTRDEPEARSPRTCTAAAPAP